MASEAQLRANAKYKNKMKEQYSEMRFKVSLEEKEKIQQYCKENNVSVSDFSRKSVLNKISSDADN